MKEDASVTARGARRVPFHSCSGCSVGTWSFGQPHASEPTPSVAYTNSWSPEQIAPWTSLRRMSCFARKAPVMSSLNSPLVMNHPE